MRFVHYTLSQVANNSLNSKVNLETIHWFCNVFTCEFGSRTVYGLCDVSSISLVKGFHRFCDVCSLGFD